MVVNLAGWLLFFQENIILMILSEQKPEVESVREKERKKMGGERKEIKSNPCLMPIVSFALNC